MNDLMDKLTVVTPGILTATSHGAELYYQLAGFIRYPEQCQTLGCPGGTPLVNKTVPL